MYAHFYTRSYPFFISFLSGWHIYYVYWILARVIGFRTVLRPTRMRHLSPILISWIEKVNVVIGRVFSFLNQNLSSFWWIRIFKYMPLKTVSYREESKGPLVISMKISPSRVEKYFIFSTLLVGTKIISK